MVSSDNTDRRDFTQMAVEQSLQSSREGTMSN